MRFDVSMKSMDNPIVFSLLSLISVAGMEWGGPGRRDVCASGVLGKASGLGSHRQGVGVLSSPCYHPPPPLALL